MGEREGPTPEEFGAWLAPKDALGRLPKDNIEAWKRAIVARLRAGEMQAAGSGDSGLAPIRDWMWRDWRIVQQDIWITGDVEFTSQAPLSGPRIGRSNAELLEPREQAKSASFLGIRFEPASFARAFKDEIAVASMPAPAKQGRPPAPWWDDLWIEIARQLYAGDLKPDSQVAIEKAMQEWLAAQGHDAGESTIRRRANRLFQALTREDQK